MHCKQNVDQRFAGNTQYTDTPRSRPEIAIAAENRTVERAERVLRAWAAADPGEPGEGLTVKQEIKAIDEAMTHKDREFLARYGGFGGAMKRSAVLQSLPEAKRDGRGLD